ncbi:MAG: hypothetical protein RLZZ156_268 [Deinococcota bacterium]|jgi:hypothetical protein
MNFAYPSTEQIPIRGRLEQVGGAASLLERLSFSGAIGVLKIGQLELHLHGAVLTHAVHAGLQNQAAALAVLQIEHGQYHFYAQDPIRAWQLEVTTACLKAMQLLDETRVNQSKPSLVILPNIKLALEYIQGIGGLQGWKARLTQLKNRTAVLLERGQWQVLAVGATWDDLQYALGI